MLLLPVLHAVHAVQAIELLPYHLLGRNKWEALKIPYPLEGLTRTPTHAEVQAVIDKFQANGLNVICNN